MGYNDSLTVRTIKVTGQTTCSSLPATLYVNLYWSFGDEFFYVDSKTIPASGSVNATFNVAAYEVPVNMGIWWFEVEGVRYNTGSMGAFTLSNGRAEFNFY